MKQFKAEQTFTNSIKTNKGEVMSIGIMIVMAIVFIAFVTAIIAVTYDKDPMLTIIPVVFLTGLCMVTLVGGERGRNELELLRQGCPTYELIETPVYSKQ